jgi:hypothetical protein
MALSSPETLGIKNRFLASLLQEGTSTAPITSHWQGADRLAKALLGGMELRDHDNASKEMAALLLGGGQTPPAVAPASAPMQASPDATRMADAISGIESGGKYDALGPVTKTGDRAYGKYQVMGSNVGPWTKAHLGQEMTPDAFLANPQAQDAVFKGQFGQYAQKYGPEGAARAWFAGEGGMNDPNRKDQLGTSVAQYGQKFAQAYGQPQMAQPPQATPQSDTVARLQQAMQSHPNPAVRQQAQQMLMQLKLQELSKDKFVPVYDQQGRVIGQRSSMTGELKADPTISEPKYEKVGEDQYGKPIYGWIDQRSRTVSPVGQSSPQGQGKPVVPPPPEGVDPKTWRERQTNQYATDNLPPDPKDVQSLRKEVQDLPSYKNIAQAAPVYKSMMDAAGRDNRAADVNLIYGMAKIMDPGSVVRESEMTVAQAVATLPQQLQATIMSQLKETGRLTPEVRAAIMQEAHSRIGAYQSMFDQDMAMYRGISQRRRMNEADVIPAFGPFDQFKPPAPPPAKPNANDGWKDLGNGIRIREKAK